MAVYTQISLQEAQELFKFIGNVQSIEGITEGVENTNYLVRLEDNQKFILTLFEKRTNKSDLPYFNNFMRKINADGISCPLSQSISGKEIFTLKNKNCCIYSFIEGRPLNDINKENLFSLGQSVVKLHQAGEDRNLFRENNMLLPSWKMITNNLQTTKEINNKNEYDYILKNINELQDLFPTDLRQFNIHADLFPDNVFFIDKKVSGFIDFFFSCTDTLVYDLATLINAWFFEKQKFNEENYSYFLNSYLQNFELKTEEKNCLNFYLKASAVRFFLTRTYDYHFNNEGEVKHKDPQDFFEIYRFHEKNNLQDFF